MSQILPNLAESNAPLHSSLITVAHWCVGWSVLTTLQDSHEDFMGAKIQLQQLGVWKQLDTSLKKPRSRFCHECHCSVIRGKNYTMSANMHLISLQP